MIILNDIDKAKLKVLIKLILIYNYPNELTSKQLSDIINTYDWGFKTAVTSNVIGRLMTYELGKHDKNFMEDINFKKIRKKCMYSMSTLK